MSREYPQGQAIVVGGGLAGFSAAHTLLEHGVRCCVIEKAPYPGGNSCKATSGINGAATVTQKLKKVQDSNQLFIDDTTKGGAKKPELVKVLCRESGPGVDWLCAKFNLDLSLLARLGGHSAERTHRGAEKFPGMTITYALQERYENYCESSKNDKLPKARLLLKTKVTNLILADGNAHTVVGVVCEDKKKQVFEEKGPVILATGGFGADFQRDSLLAKFRADLLHLPTTNGAHATGDGIKMTMAIGGSAIDLEWVQVHPTGLVKIGAEDEKIKFLAAEALRGVGGLLIDKNGKRFCNELGRRDYVTGLMWKNEQPFRLILNKKASEEIIWHCKHYLGRGVMKHYKSGREFCESSGINLQVLINSHEEHYQVAQKTLADPEGGPYPGYPKGASWDKVSGTANCTISGKPAGKKFFANVIPGSAVADEEFYVAIVTPVIHYCMGGIEVDERGRVVREKSKEKELIQGLYAAGEVAGGVHGNNRLGGNSLLDCVAYGRVCGRTCAQYCLENYDKFSLTS